MPADTHTLDLFFGLESEDGKAPQELTAAVRAAVAKEIREAAKTVAAARLFTGKAPETQLDLAATEVISFLRRAIADVSIPQVLAGCWSKYAALRKYSNARDYPADKTYVEPFFTQTLTSAHHPFIELKLGGVPTGKVEFEVEVQVTFEEVSLSIRGGRIVAARPARRPRLERSNVKARRLSRENSASWSCPVRCTSTPESRSAPRVAASKASVHVRRIGERRNRLLRLF